MANTSLQIVEVPDFIEESSEYDIKYKRTANGTLKRAILSGTERTEWWNVQARRAL